MLLADHPVYYHEVGSLVMVTEFIGENDLLDSLQLVMERSMDGTGDVLVRFTTGMETWARWHDVMPIEEDERRKWRDALDEHERAALERAHEYKEFLEVNSSFRKMNATVSSIEKKLGEFEQAASDFEHAYDLEKKT